MKEIFVINGGQHFAHSGGRFNHTLPKVDKTFFTESNSFVLKTTDINEAYHPASWNAPQTAFTLPGEFFLETSVDDGVMFAFHRMNVFIGMGKLNSFHFHVLEKNGTQERI